MQDFAPWLECAFPASCPEASTVVRNVQGEIPAFVRGACFMNGPGRFEVGGLRYQHWLDGDGLIRSLEFGPDCIRFSNRFVRSGKFTAEEQTGEPVFRTFGTAFSNDKLRRGLTLESPVNVSVLQFNGSLLAFGEQGVPWQLDPFTLQTLQPYTFQGAINEISPFSAHPKIDRATGELFNFGVSFSDPPFLNFYRFDSDGRQKIRKRIPLPYPCSLHDFALSRRFAIFHLSPYLLDIKAFLLDRRSLFDSLAWRPEQEYRLLILDRNDGNVATSVPTDTGYCLHWINAFESGALLTLDFVEFERPIYDQYRPLPHLFHTAPLGRPVRCEIDLSTSRLIKRTELDFTCAPDFPIIPPQFAGRAGDRFWILGISATGAHGRKFFDRLACADWNTRTVSDIYSTPAGHYLAGEPVYAGNPRDSSEGIVLCQMLDAVNQRSSFVLFDASNLKAGPISTISLDRLVPPAFHAAFEPHVSHAETGGV